MKSLGCSVPMIEKCTHGPPLTLGNHKTLSCGHKYSPCLPLTHALGTDSLKSWLENGCDYKLWLRDKIKL